MTLVSMKEMLITAKAEGYAVGQFNINNLEWTQAILQAAEEEKSPVILGVSEGAGKYMGGFITVVKMVEGLMESYKTTVPVAIHLDHGSSFEKCKEAIDAGFTSVMIDASHHPFEENVAITKEVVEYAHAKGVSVEAWNLDLVSQVVLDGEWQYEVTISKTLHQCRCTEAVCTVVREVTLTDSEETLYRGLQLIVNPDTTHGVVDSRVDHHWGLVWIVISDLLIHLEEVAVTVSNSLLAKTVDSVREIKEYCKASSVYAEALIAALLGST